MSQKSTNVWFWKMLVKVGAHSIVWVVSKVYKHPKDKGSESASFVFGSFCTTLMTQTTKAEQGLTISNFYSIDANDDFTSAPRVSIEIWEEYSQ